MRKVDAAGNTTTAERTRPSYVTPTQFAALVPADGDEAYLVADATNGVIWHFRYNAGSASTFKWEFLGGSDMRAEVVGGEATASSTFVDLATVLSIVIPRAGDYSVQWGARSPNSPSGNTGLTHSLAWGATAAGFSPNAISGVAASGPTAIAIAGKKVITAAASDTLKVQYQANAAISASAAMRYLFVRPVRVS